MPRLLGALLAAGASLLVLALYLVAMDESVGGGPEPERRLQRLARPIPVYEVQAEWTEDEETFLSTRVRT